ncbi:MAG: helicase-exonuclease AddAB subunit AddA [Eubacterium sp.]
MEWTKEQKTVIDLRGCNILVSAAAGSGKTAVLIERIVSQVTDPVNPINLDEFVIVTFTRLAAAQMKEKLQAALEKKLEENPENIHLQRQIMILPVTQISTIHSFCGYIIQNYFHQTGVDPSYRVANESELSMIRSDVLAELLEEQYTKLDDDFVDMAKMAKFIKSDTEMEKIILKLYYDAMSEPFPEDFFARMRQFLSCESVEELEQTEFIRKNMEFLKNLIKGIYDEYESWIQICYSKEGPIEYLDFLKKERTEFENFDKITSFETMRKRVDGISFGRLPAKPGSVADPKKKEIIKSGRTDVKKLLKTLQPELLGESLPELLETMKQMRGKLLTFLSLTEQFMDRYQEAKREKNIADFNDLEQMALEILVRKEGGKIVRTQAAEELSEQFHEIMIDEYQDSNLVQELILGSVAKENNRFMVGDIKQSIYRFRNARPDLFLEKMTTYETAEGAKNRLVFLTKNFRSRDIVLEATNAVFADIMQEDFGGITYDDKAKLYLGADFPETTRRHADSVTVYGITDKAEKEVEAHVIAKTIDEYVNSDNPMYVKGEDGEYRPANYGDIAILMRSTQNGGQDLLDVLNAHGIPAHLEAKSGFFDTKEIRIIVNLLTILDNPRQDIALAAVLRGPIGGLSDDDLAKIRGNSEQHQFYDALCQYSGEEALEEKIDTFLEKLERWREKTTYTPVFGILEEIFEETKLMYFFETMGNGLQRKANIQLLLEMAREFDQGSYQGLFQFVRYIRGIKEREEDFGEVNLSGDRENVVQIMTIHKSKGLEFPICFVASMHKRLGHIERDFVVVNGDVGIGSDVIDSEEGTKKKSVYYTALTRNNAIEDLAEEMRILYVAMTRAKEKLILSGRENEKMWMGNSGYYSRVTAGSYFDWILPVVAKNNVFDYVEITDTEIQNVEIARQADCIIDEKMLCNFDTSVVYDKETEQTLRFMEEYHRQVEDEIPTKVSVSELKKKSMEASEEENFTVLYSDALENQSPIPNFAKKEDDDNQALAGARYGTVWHQVMASLCFARATDEKEVENQLEDMVQSGRIHAQEKNFILPWKVVKFLHSDLGQAMTEAEKSGKLYREQPFVTSVSAEEVQETSSDERVLVQGIIDGFYETDTGIVVMDYKTDHLEKGQEEVLIKRYRTQMEVYAEALEKITGKTVEKKVLYCFSLNKEIEV